MADKRDLYWQARLRDVERRIERLEAKLMAKEVSPNNDSDFYSLEEFAHALGVHRITITRKIKAGQIKAVKVGRYWRIPKTELEEIFEQ